MRAAGQGAWGTRIWQRYPLPLAPCLAGRRLERSPWQSSDTAIYWGGMAILHENVVLIECTDDVALDELLAATPLAVHVIHQLSPRAVLVDPEYLDTVIQAMVQKGYTPRISP
jgi:hypothetical protein